MKYFFKVLIIASAAFVWVSCGDSRKEKQAALNDKKTELEKLKSESNKTQEKIKSLESEIAKLDPEAGKIQKAKLVAIQTLQPSLFEHFIELQGKVDADNISYITPRGPGGQVKAIYVKQGDFVKKGQLLLKLDDAVLRQNLTAARQGLETIKVQLEYAKNIYQRQKNLWEQNIGTEVQLITAKNNVSSLEAQLKASSENVQVISEQLNMANVYSNVSGVADMVNIKIGEVFTGNPFNGIKIVNTSSLKAVSEIPENYLASVVKGTSVIVNIPDLHRVYNSTLSFVGASIDPATRGFAAEAKLPHDPALKPNQIALVKIKDYANPSAIIVPVNTLQNDEKGKFIMVAVKEKDKLIARKRFVNIGMLNGDQLEIKQGLQAGDILITEGFQSLYDGLPVTTQ